MVLQGPNRRKPDVSADTQNNPSRNIFLQIHVNKWQRQHPRHMFTLPLCYSLDGHTTAGPQYDNPPLSCPPSPRQRLLTHVARGDFNTLWAESSLRITFFVSHWLQFEMHGRRFGPGMVWYPPLVPLTPQTPFPNQRRTRTWGSHREGRSRPGISLFSSPIIWSSRR